ncbi:MAG: ribosome small subunit-dependent GTPase A [Deltaproteobacteria bacterium]|nr:ribosome small subunit-dependent GTPase A [Deltaproteobacteria bacterium]
MELSQLGWDEQWLAAFQALRPCFASLALEPGRVLRQDRGWFKVLTAQGERLSRAAGKLAHGAENALELPVVGDWVAIAFAHSKREATVHAVLPRRSLLARRMAGNDEPQPIAANADVAFLVHGLDQEPHLRRTERALAMIAASGAQPVLVLNKVDLAADAPKAIAEVQAIAHGVAVLALSAERGDGMDAFAALLPPGRTGVLLGPSGAGKSSLANRLLGEARLATGAVRAGDFKGRHTTTRRELVLLPSGALLIDGPGVREFGLLEGELAETFPDIDALAVNCRFRDCAHASEPGCAVRAAAERGELDPDRLESFLKLRRELDTGTSGARAERHGKRKR